MEGKYLILGYHKEVSGARFSQVYHINQAVNQAVNLMLENTNCKKGDLRIYLDMHGVVGRYQGIPLSLSGESEVPGCDINVTYREGGTTHLISIQHVSAVLVARWLVIAYDYTN